MRKVVNLSKAVLVLILILCLCVVAVTIENDKLCVDASTSTLIVPDHHPMIQEAINNAKSGDTIFVRSGIYYENIIINKTITLIGENRENLIIDGKAGGKVVLIKETSNVIIKGFTIRNSYPFTGCGVLIERSKNVTIYNNNVINNGIGIQILYSSENQIYENMISTNHISIHIFYSSRNAIYRNSIFKNGDGIHIYYYSVDNKVYENDIHSNRWGIYLALNNYNNTFFRNNFFDNVRNVIILDEQTANTWFYGGEGNYWDDYAGKDLDKNGIGDTPYTVNEYNVDYYPLFGRFQTFSVLFKERNYLIAIVSNSTISNFILREAAEFRSHIIYFTANITKGSSGFCRVVIPKKLMENIHVVLINEQEVNATLLDVRKKDSICLYVEYSSDCSVKIVYLRLLDEINNLSVTCNALAKQFAVLNQTLNILLQSYNDFKDAFFNMSALYQNQLQNFKGLTYVFAAVVAIFIMVTIYLSKVAHTKQGRIVES